MELTALKKIVVEGNKELPKRDLVKYSWGNVSAIDRERGVIVIKPVGIPYDELTVENISVVDLVGKVLEGPFDPSVDLDIHRALYEHFKTVCAIVHTHSTYATAFSQADIALPCLGTTHADYFAGPIPCVGRLTETQVQSNYEWETGMEIVRYFHEHGIDPLEVPASLSPFHGPFTWGSDVWDAVHKSVVLEEICKMAVFTRFLSVRSEALPSYMLEAHYLRKHGPGARFNKDDYGAGMISRQK